VPDFSGEVGFFQPSPKLWFDPFSPQGLHDRTHPARLRCRAKPNGHARGQADLSRASRRGRWQGAQLYLLENGCRSLRTLRPKRWRSGTVLLINPIMEPSIRYALLLGETLQPQCARPILRNQRANLSRSEINRTMGIIFHAPHSNSRHASV
jgi:hypothetical protein